MKNKNRQVKQSKIRIKDKKFNFSLNQVKG